MGSFAVVVFFHARTPTLLPFASAAVHREFLEYPEPRRLQYARDFIVSKHSGWHAAIRLSVHGLLEGVDKLWLKQHFEDDVLEFVVDDSNGKYAERTSFDEWYDRSSIREHYSLCRRTLKDLGLLSLTPPDWLATRFEARDLAKALIQGGHSGMDREWYENAFSDDSCELERVLMRFGLTEYPPDAERDYYVTEVGLMGYGLILALDAAGLLDDREWLCEKIKGSLLLTGMERGGILTADVGRDWYARHMRGGNPDESPLYEALSKVGLLTAECGRDWYAEYFSDAYLLRALKETGLLTDECGLDWYVKKFQYSCWIYEAVRRTELIHTCTRDELADALSGKHLYKALERGGKLVQGAGDTEWYAARLPSKYLLRALRLTGLLTPGLGRGWYVQHLKGHHLLTALDESGLLTAEPGTQWYVDTFTYPMYERAKTKTPNVRLLHQALLKAGLLKAELGHDWCFALAGHHKIWSNDNPIIAMLRDAGLLVPEAGIEWYKRHFGGRALFEVLDETGLLPRDETLDWYRARFQGRALYEVLARTGAVEKIDSDFANEHLYRYSNRMKKYRDFALFRAGLLQDDGSRRWLASHLEGQDLYDALETNGHLDNSDVHYSWYCYRFEGPLLLRCLQRTGDIPHMSTKHIYHFLEGDEFREATKIKRDFWRRKRYPYPWRPTGPTYFGHDYDDSWSVWDTDSRHSAGYQSSFEESVTSSDALIDHVWTPTAMERVASVSDESEYSFFVSQKGDREQYESHW